MGFKRNSSRFGRGSRDEGSKSNRREEREDRDGGDDREERSSRGGRDRGGRGGKSGGGAKFTRLGNFTLPKKAGQDEEDAANDLRDSGLRLNLQIYPPKGVNSVTLNRGDRLYASFETNDKDPDFAYGTLFLVPEEN